MREPDFGMAMRGSTSIRYCEFWVYRGGHERCKASAYFITDDSITLIEGYFCEEHMLIQAVKTEEFMRNLVVQ